MLKIPKSLTCFDECPPACLVQCIPSHVPNVKPIYIGDPWRTQGVALR